MGKTQILMTILLIMTISLTGYSTQNAFAVADITGVATITGPNEITVVFTPGVGGANMVAAPITSYAAGDLALSAGGTRDITGVTTDDLGATNTIVYTFSGAATATDVTATLNITTQANITDNVGNTSDGVAISATDAQVPVVLSAATTSSTTIALTMSETVTIDSAVPGDFTIAGVASTPAVTNLSGSGSTTLTLTLGDVIVNGESPTVTYTLNSNVIDDGVADNQLAAFVDQAVTNNVAGVGQANNGGGSGCKGDCIHPSIGLDKNGVRLVDNGFSYNNNAVDAILFHTPFPLISAHVGNTNTVSIKAWDNNGPNGIALVQMGLGVPEIGSPLNDAEVIIEVWISNTVVEKIVVSDPHNLIENSAVTVQSELVDCRAGSDEQCVGITLKHVYREAPLYNVMSVEVMDVNRHVQSTTFNDGVEVLGESMNPADTINVLPKAPQNYPQTSGTVLLTQIDRAEQMWIDPYGYVWQGDKSKMTLISEIPFVRFQDSESEFSGYNDRLNSNFEMYKEEQIDGAQMVFDYLTSYKQIQGDDLTDYVGKTFYNVPLERADDVKLQQDILDEQVRATVTFEQILDASFVPKN